MKARVTKEQFQDLHAMFVSDTCLDPYLKKYLPASDEPEYLLVFQCFMSLLHAQKAAERIKVLDFIKNNVDIIG